MIRSLELSDRADWDRLWLGYQTFYKVTIEAETSQTTFKRLLDPAEPMHGALFLNDGRPVGLVHFIYHRSTWTISDYCYLQDLFVEGEMRGRGCGRALIEHVYASAAIVGASRVHWLTHETNLEAMILYERVAEKPGFVQYRKRLL